MAVRIRTEQHFTLAWNALAGNLGSIVIYSQQIVQWSSLYCVAQKVVKLFILPCFKVTLKQMYW